jgi:hypothetical protein
LFFLKRRLSNYENISYNSIFLEVSGDKTNTIVTKGSLDYLALKKMFILFDSSISLMNKDENYFTLYENYFLHNSVSFSPTRYTLISFESRDEKNEFKKRTLEKKNMLELITLILFSKKEKI